MTPPVAELDCPVPIPRGKPVEAMQGSPGVLSSLPADFDQLPVADAVRTLLETVVDHHGLYFELNRRHRALVEWIEGEDG